MKPPVFPLKVFYDGSCRVCSSEMESYMKKAPPGRLEFIDISRPDLEPYKYGKTLEELMRVIHVQDGEGRFFTGLDGLLAIWTAFPVRSYFGILRIMLSLPVIRPLAGLAYSSFAKNRRFLPKKSRG